MNFLRTHRVWIVTAGAGLVSFLTPSVNAFVVANPQYGIALATAWAVATAWAKSPRQ